MQEQLTFYPCLYCIGAFQPDMNYRDLTHCKTFPPHQHQGEKASHRVDVIGKKLCCPLGPVKACSLRVGELLTQDLGSGLPRSPDCWRLALLSPMAFRCQPKFQAQLIVWHVTLAQRKRRKRNKEPVRSGDSAPSLALWVSVPSPVGFAHQH